MVNHSIGTVTVPFIFSIQNAGSAPFSEVKASSISRPIGRTHMQDIPVLTIEVALSEEVHTNNDTVSTQREAIYDLLDEPASNVDISIQEFTGWLGVISVEIPSENSGIVVGDIEALFFDNDKYNQDDLA